MARERLLTVRDVAIYFGVSEKEVVDLAENGKLPGYKVGGVYLRFKREQVEEFKRSSLTLSQKSIEERRVPWDDRVKDFFHFNDFYIVSMLLISCILFVIFRGY